MAHKVGRLFTPNKKAQKKKGEDYSETIFIYQEELQGVVLSEKVFNVSSEKQNVEVKFQTNAYVEYDVAEDSKEWISVLQMGRNQRFK